MDKICYLQINWWRLRGVCIDERYSKILATSSTQLWDMLECLEGIPLGLFDAVFCSPSPQTCSLKFQWDPLPLLPIDTFRVLLFDLWFQFQSSGLFYFHLHHRSLQVSFEEWRYQSTAWWNRSEYPHQLYFDSANVWPRPHNHTQCPLWTHSSKEALARDWSSSIDRYFKSNLRKMFNFRFGVPQPEIPSVGVLWSPLYVWWHQILCQPKPFYQAPTRSLLWCLRAQLGFMRGRNYLWSHRLVCLQTLLISIQT